jgi:hypothetical protein
MLHGAPWPPLVRPVYNGPQDPSRYHHRNTIAAAPDSQRFFCIVGTSRPVSTRRSQDRAYSLRVRLDDHPGSLGRARQPPRIQCVRKGSSCNEPSGAPLGSPFSLHETQAPGAGGGYFATMAEPQMTDDKDLCFHGPKIGHTKAVTSGSRAPAHRT